MARQGRLVGLMVLVAFLVVCFAHLSDQSPAFDPIPPGEGSFYPFLIQVDEAFELSVVESGAFECPFDSLVVHDLLS